LGGKGGNARKKRRGAPNWRKKRPSIKAESERMINSREEDKKGIENFGKEIFRKLLGE